MFSGSFHGQLRLIFYIKLTSIKREPPFIISKRQFLIWLCFIITINKSQSQSFNFVSVNLHILVFTYKQLYIALLRVININGLSLLLPQEGDAAITNIIYLEVLLRDNIIIVVVVTAGQ